MPYIGRDIESITFNSANNLNVVGNITLSGTVDGRDVATDGTKLDTVATNAIANLSEDTTPQLGGNLDLNTSNVIGTGNINVTGSITGTSFVSTGDMSFTNNSKAIFGTSPSLEIYHDGSNSILDDVGAGNFKMQLAGADKLEITSTGVDVTGSVVADGLTVDGTAEIRSTGPTQLLIEDTDNGFAATTLSVENGGRDFHINPPQDIVLKQGGTIAQKIFTGGDISFYDSTGVSMGFFWDASTQRLGLGTTTPTSPLHISSSAGEAILISNSNASGNSQIKLDGATDFQIGTGQASSGFANKLFVYDATNAATRLVIDSSGNVGIGTASPTASKLQVDGTDGTIARFRTTSGSNNTVINITSNDSAGTAGLSVGGNSSFPAMTFENGGSERLRIDSSGNLLIGKTSLSGTTAGLQVKPAGELSVVRDGNHALILNRQTSDGSLALFQKSATTVGSIGSFAGNSYFAGSGCGLRPRTGDISPTNASGSTNDGGVDLGTSSNRFNNIFLSGSISDGTNSKTVADIVSSGSGGLIQTVSTHHTTSTTISGTAFTQYSGLNTSITPTSSSNKVLVTVHINMSSVGDSFPAFRIYRGGTWIGQSNTVSPGIETTFAHAVPTGGASVTVQMGVASFTFLDSPSTTNATTYSVYISPMRTTSRTLRINESYSRGDDNQYSGGSTMTLMEVT